MRFIILCFIVFHLFSNENRTTLEMSQEGIYRVFRSNGRNFFVREEEDKIVQAHIDYQKDLMSSIAQDIMRRRKPNLKQIHLISSNGSYMFSEALKQLPEEFRETVLVIAADAISIIDPNLACEVYNIIGSNNWPSQMALGGFSRIEEGKKRMNLLIIPQDENDYTLNGQYFSQPAYQREIENIQNQKLRKKYAFH